MSIKSLPLVRALPSNQKGRDFVVGDLHGCFDLLDRLLEAVRFGLTLHCVHDGRELRASYGSSEVVDVRQKLSA